MEHEKILRINELAKKKKDTGLTDAEAAEQAELRKEYLEAFKANMQATLDNVYILNEDGTEEKLTPKDEKASI
jgi:Uncharacterized protein conserved in bacteria